MKRSTLCIISLLSAIICTVAQAQLPSDFRSEQIALCAQQAACQPGDTVTVQGQVTCLAANRIMPFSNYLYIELINPNDSIVTRQKITCKSKGAFTAALPVDPLGAYGVYYIRAYTQLMRNFSPESFAVQPLLVGQSFPEFDTTTTDGLRCSILPHGGHLCSGAPQNITVRVANYLNDPLSNIPLALTNENGDTIATKRTSASGLAMMSFIPQPGAKYSMNLVYEDVKKIFPMEGCNDALPIIKASLKGSQVAFAIKGGSDDVKNMQLYVFDRLNGISHITLNRPAGSFRLANAPQLLTLFLTDANCSLLAQCTVMALPDESTQPTLPQTASVGKPITLPDFGDDANVMARLVPLNTRWVEHAQSQLLYLSDLQSPLPFPEHYYSLDEHERNTELMAWLGTTSFKRFDIANAVKQDSAIYTFLPEDVLYFQGKITTPSKKPYNKGSLVAYNTEDNSTYNAELNNKGEFAIAVDDFLDGTRFFLQAVNQKNKPEAMYVNINDETYPAFTIAQRKTLEKNRYVTTEVTYHGGNWDKQELPEIVVKARTKYDNYHSTDQFYGHSVKSREVIEERGFLTLLDILRDIPGVYIKKAYVKLTADGAIGMDDEDNAEEGAGPGGLSETEIPKIIKYGIYSSRGPSSLGKNKNNQLVMLINGKRTVEPIELLMAMPSAEIESVEYLRPWQALTYTFGALNGAINVITRNGPTKSTAKSKGTMYTPMGLTPQATASPLVANNPGNYRLIVDVVSPKGIHSYESVVKALAQ